MTPRSLHGFSLLEVLVALAIVSLMLGVIYQIFGQTARASHLRAEYGDAIALAESILAGYASGDRPGATSPGASPRFRTQVNARPFVLAGTDGSSPRLRLVQVTATVFWSHAGREKRVELTTLKPALTH